MYYDDYSTSFQSLYSPMYNLQTNYSMMNNAGAGYGMGAGYGVGAGYGMGMYPMGIYNGSMTNVAVGQFGADQLIKDDPQLNNYYARPIATHKKEDELPTILGILGTALGTAAMLLALRKGKKAPKVKPAPTPNPTTAPTGGNNVIDNPWKIPGSSTGAPGSNYQTKNLPAVVTKTPANATGQSGANAEEVVQQVKFITNKDVDPTLVPIVYGQGVNNSFAENLRRNAVDAEIVEQSATRALVANQPVKGLLSAHYGVDPNKALSVVPKQTVQLKPIEEYLPKSENVFQLPASQVRGYLPAPSAVDANKLPAVVSKQPANSTTFKEYVTKDDINLDNIPFGVQVFLPANYKALNKVNKNIELTNPEIARLGRIVHTTHTPETLANANSIGANAKGADKLAELLKNMNA